MESIRNNNFDLLRLAGLRRYEHNPSLPTMQWRNKQQMVCSFCSMHEAPAAGVLATINLQDT